MRPLYWLSYLIWYRGQSSSDPCSLPVRLEDTKHGGCDPAQAAWRAGRAAPAAGAAAAAAVAAAVGGGPAGAKAKPMGNGAGPDVRLSPHTSLESTPFPQTPRGFTGSGVVGGSGNSAGSLAPAAPLMDPNRAFQARPVWLGFWQGRGLGIRGASAPTTALARLAPAVPLMDPDSLIAVADTSRALEIQHFQAALKPNRASQAQ